MATTWQDYQDEAAAFFRSLDLDAKTDITIKGVRTSHDVDVLVKLQHVGFEVTWIVECKHWQEAVTKLHVLALREIVTDVGADRGILLCEAGFQSGAYEAATLTNVRLTSLAELQGTASSEVLSMRLRELYDRIGIARDRYWSIPKRERIEHGLRPAVGQDGYSTMQVLDLANEWLTKAFRGAYPLETDRLAALVLQGCPLQFNSPGDLVATLEPMIREVETKLDTYENQGRDRGN
jgi:Restriction endonuclease.